MKWNGGVLIYALSMKLTVSGRVQSRPNRSTVDCLRCFRESLAVPTGRKDQSAEMGETKWDCCRDQMDSRSREHELGQLKQSGGF